MVYAYIQINTMQVFTSISWDLIDLHD